MQTVLAELERQRTAARDFRAASKLLRFTAGHVERDEKGKLLTLGRPTLALEGVDDFPIRPLAERQIAEWAGIPAKYYDAMRGSPGLLEHNVNHWLQERQATRLVRTLDGDVRAFLGASYRRLDNYELMTAVAPVLDDEGVQIRSCEVTETRLFVQAVTSRFEGEVRKDDIVQAGVLVRGSEVGHGLISVEGLIFRLVCLNGTVMPDASLRKAHVGRTTLTDGVEEEMLADSTKALTDAALWAQVRDLTRAVLDESVFQRNLDKLRSAAEATITANPVKVVELASRKVGLSEAERDGVLEHLFRDAGVTGVSVGNLTRYDLANAITRTAEDAVSYDRAYDLERIGGQVIELGARDWSALNQEAKLAA